MIDDKMKMQLPCVHDYQIEIPGGVRCQKCGDRPGELPSITPKTYEQGRQEQYELMRHDCSGIDACSPCSVLYTDCPLKDNCP